MTHGTYAGYQEHRRRNQPACTPCRRANAAYQRTYRKRGCIRGLGWPR